MTDGSRWVRIVTSVTLVTSVARLGVFRGRDVLKKASVVTMGFDEPK